VSLRSPASLLASPARLLGASWHSPALRVTAAFTLGGAGFALANLLLARTLPQGEYGLLALVMGLLSVTTQIAPLGIDLLMPRRGVVLDRRLWPPVLGASLIVALVSAVGSAAGYHLGAREALLLAVGTFAGGIIASTAAHFQSRQSFSISVPLSQSSNGVILAAALVATAAPSTSLSVLFAIIGVGYASAALLGWLLTRRDWPSASTEPMPWLWQEALPLVTANGASLVLMQLERLVIPGLLSLHDLATFGVVGSLAAAPFRMMQSAVIYTMLPRLRQAPSAAARRHLLALEGGLVVVAMLVVAGLVGIFLPIASHWILRDKYVLGTGLVIATIVSGVLKVLNAFVTTVISALGDGRHLGQLTVVAWLSVGVGVAAAVVGARWGLTGVVWGVAAGWAVRCAALAWLSRPHLALDDHPVA
jgi:O-antigen/teichoic acid export membrane protein